ADLGRVRAVGPAGRDKLVRLGDAIEATIPPATSAASIIVAGVNEGNAFRTAITYETTFLEREALLGRLYGGRRPALVQAQNLQVVRAFLDRLAPREASAAMDPLSAIEAVAGSASIDPTMVRLLIRLLGVLPVGSVVELESGEWAVVSGASANPDAHDRPRI